MPVTAKLSRRFYEQLGDEVTNELVEWFNSVDATYRGDLRELNELNFARFDANVEARFATQDATLERRFAAVDVRFAALDATLERRFAAMDVRFEAMNSRFATTEKRLIGWMFAFWTGTMLAQAAFLYAVLRARS